MGIEELIAKAKEDFGQNVYVLPPGDMGYTARVGEITDSGSGPAITVWPYPYKDQTFSLKNVKISDDGWVVQGDTGNVRLRALKPGETGPADA